MSRQNRYHGNVFPNTWTSQEPVNPVSTTAGYLGRFVDIDPVDFEFLIARIGQSESAKSAVNALALKLKLEFGDELAKHKQDAIDAVRKANEKAARQKAAQASQAKAYKAQLKKQAKHFNVQLEEIIDFLDKHFVTKIDEIPVYLHETVAEVDKQRMLRTRLLSRRLYIAGDVDNPYLQHLIRSYSNR